MAAAGLVKGSVRGFLLDITGVLYNSSKNGLGEAIPGSAEAVKRLYEESRVRFVSNDSCATPKQLVEKLCKLGIFIDVKHVFTPISAAISYVKKRGLRPHLLVNKSVLSEFANLDVRDPNCVVLGDAEDDFTYENLNHAFRVLMEHPFIITLGFGKFYRRVDGYSMDVGCYAKALQHAADARIEIIGKPNEAFFVSAVEDMSLSKEEVIMVGDDIVGDVAAAKAAGIRAALVRTGKWRQEWENHEVRPDIIADNLKDVVARLLS